MKKYLLFVYTDEFVELNLISKLNLNFLSDCEICFSNGNISHDDRKKIAVVGLSEEPHISNKGNLLVRDLSTFDLLIVYGREDVWKDFESIKREMLDLYNNDKICVLAGGIDYRTMSPEYFYPVLNHFKLTVLSSKNDQYKQKTKKDYLFDALLGTPKSHRKYIFYKLIDDNLLTKSLVNIGIDQDYYINFDYDDLWPDISQDFYLKYGAIKPYLSEFFETTKEYSDLGNDKINVNDSNNSLMASINAILHKKNTGHNYFHRAYTTPYHIFDNSWYSIVSETYQNYRFQPTEKTAKVFLGGRIFVCFTCHHFLKNLKSLGFRTFDSIIDESYDDIEDTRTRFDMAWEQIQYLSTSNHLENYDKMKEVLDHNRALILDLTFQLDKIENFIYESIEKLSR